MVECIFKWRVRPITEDESFCKNQSVNLGEFWKMIQLTTLIHWATLVTRKL